MKKKKKIVENNLVYVQIEGENVINSQRNILSYQMGLLNLLKSMKRYGLIRQEEMEAKIELQNNIKEIEKNMRKIMENFPKVKEYGHKEKERPERTPAVEYYNQDLETQLEQIRRKLEEIGR
jgi:hypothetical protein